MKLKHIVFLFKLLNIILNFIFGINFFKLDFINYFSTINEFKITKGIEIEDSPLVKRDKTQLKILLVFFGSFIMVIGVVIFLIKIGDDGSSASDIISSITNTKSSEGNINISSQNTTSKPMSSVDDVD